MTKYILVYLSRQLFGWELESLSMPITQIKLESCKSTPWESMCLFVKTLPESMCIYILEIKWSKKWWRLSKGNAHYNPHALHCLAHFVYPLILNTNKLTALWASSGHDQLKALDESSGHDQLRALENAFAMHLLLTACVVKSQQWWSRGTFPSLTRGSRSLLMPWSIDVGAAPCTVALFSTVIDVRSWGGRQQFS
jgi:hypothetical protein